MKRANNDGEGRGGGGKRYREAGGGYDEALAAGKFELRLLIPTKAAGAVIGKGGEYIKAVREKFDASITVKDRATTERVLVITCNKDTIHECFSEVLHKLAEEQRKEEVDIRVLVHQSHAGAIIGRGGTKIKELKEQTGCVIRVYKDCAPNSNDRVMSVIGTQDKIPGAVRILVDFMVEVPVKGPWKCYDASNYDPRMLDYGGYVSDRNVSGAGGGYMGAPRVSGGPPIPPPPYGDPYRGGATGGGPPGGSFGSRGYEGGRPPMGGGFMGEQVTTNQSTQVTIPNELGGTIIGKGGERINRIRQESGARIDVGAAYGNDERIITITGTPHQIQMAQYLLQQSVRTSEAGRRYLRDHR